MLYRSFFTYTLKTWNDFCSAISLPVFGISNYSDPQWIREPTDRGAWGLVQSCLLILGLCVYSAIHLIVVHRDCGWWARGFIRGKWLVVAPLAPEFIVFNAWFQRQQAVRKARLLRRLHGQDEPSSRTWTLWGLVWPRPRIFDPERPKRQEKQRGGHTSESRSQKPSQEIRLSWTWSEIRLN